MKLIVSANIGLGNAKKNTANEQRRVNTHARLHDALARVYNGMEHILPDILALQECGEYSDFCPSPFFGTPVATNSDLLKQEDSKARGVSIFAKNNFSGKVIDNTGWEDEIVAITDSYSQKGIKKEFGLINVYRLTNKNQKRTVKETSDKIKDILKIFKTKYSIRNYIILGDFNTESTMSFGAGISENFHTDLYHKHNSTTKKTKIDRVFTKIPRARISLVLPSIEAINKGDSESEKLGHKVYVVQIGEAKATSSEKTAEAAVPLKRLGKKVKSENPNLVSLDFTEIQKMEKVDKIKTMNFLAEDLNKEALKFTEDCKIKRLKSNRRKNAILMSEVERVEEQVLCGKKPDKALIRLVDGCKNGLESAADSAENCSLLDKSSKLSKKLKNLNPTDLEKGKAIAERLYKNSQNVNY